MFDLDFSQLNWLAVVASIVAGQVISTIWFVVLWGTPWAKEYGAKSQQEHTKEIPIYTYFIGLVCTSLLVISIALLQQHLAVDTLKEAFVSGLFVAVGFCVATSLPGYIFLKRWSAFLLAIGSQFVMILAISVILALWK